MSYDKESSNWPKLVIRANGNGKFHSFLTSSSMGQKRAIKRARFCALTARWNGIEMVGGKVNGK
jgi:hypothetical protein